MVVVGRVGCSWASRSGTGSGTIRSDRRPASSASEITSRSGSPTRPATRAASSCSTFTRPGLTFTRTGKPATSTVSVWRADGQRSMVAPRTPSEPVSRGEHLGDLGAERDVGERRHGVGGPALLHDDRRDPRVVGAGVEQRADVWASVSPVASSTLTSSTTTGCPPSTASLGSPITTWVALGWPSMSRVPAPKPLQSMVIGGIGPKPDASAASERGARSGW